MKTKIHFIVNPIAGSGKNHFTEDFLYKYFEESEFEIRVKESEYSKHAITLANESIKENVNVLVACGGDGTINEVASCIVNSEIILGVIPIGSGNGLASNLNIPKKINKALQTIIHANFISIDVGKINNQLFFSNTGIGFGAQVIYEFEKSKKRKLISYISSVFKALKNYTYNNVLELTINGETKTVYPFLFFISNSNEMGYNMSLTPKASLQDGLLDVICAPKLSRFKILLFGVLFLFKKHSWLKEAHCFQAKKLHIQKHDNTFFSAQKDGESIVIKSDSLEINIIPKALKVYIP